MSLSLQSLGRLLAMQITFWLNAYSIIQMSSFLSLLERIWGLGEDIVLNCISPTNVKV